MKPPLEFVQSESYVGVMVLLAVLDGVLVTVLDWVLLALVAWDLVWDLVRDVLAVALLATKEQLKQEILSLLSMAYFHYSCCKIKRCKIITREGNARQEDCSPSTPRQPSLEFRHLLSLAAR